MPRKRKASGSKSPKRRTATPKEQAPVKEGAPLAGHVIERPDGFYWEAKKGETHGPFATLAEAEADMLAGGASEEDDVEVPRVERMRDPLGRERQQLVALPERGRE